MTGVIVTAGQQPQRTVVSVAGELDLHTLPALQEATFEAHREPVGKRITAGIALADDPTQTQRPMRKCTDR
ncbi:hypothetical protein [Streptomyces lateritius]|uniref:hypothetical protein n=1 Tax=Streptomyces lateritius TaxID=67313 RepID=UPI0016743FA9|nr:hypothetical protein [Streptomyces lateritius]GGU11725.1 hypothetical protein GCM10010272_66080 [Streptomyces lateritius]